MEKPYILAVDPGLMNGVCLVKRDGPEKVWSDELLWRPLWIKVNETLAELGGKNVDFVVEKFLITIQTATNSQAPWSLEEIGRMKALAWLHGCDGPDDGLTLQKTGDAKDFATGDRLRAVGLWHRGGKGHAKDALRHAFLRLVNTGWRDPRILG